MKYKILTRSNRYAGLTTSRSMNLYGLIYPAHDISGVIFEIVERKYRTITNATLRVVIGLGF